MESPEEQVLCEMVSTCDRSPDDIIEIEVGLLKQDWAEACDTTIAQQNRLLSTLIERHYPFYAKHNATQKLAEMLNTHLGTTLTGRNLTDRYRRVVRLPENQRPRTPQVMPVVFGYDILWGDRSYHLLITKHEIVYGWQLLYNSGLMDSNVSTTREGAIREAVQAIIKGDVHANWVPAGN